VFQQTRETVDESNTAIGAKPMAVPCGLRLLGLVNLDTTAATRIRFASTSSFRNYHRKKGSIIRNKEAGELATFFAVPCADPRSIEIRQQRTLRAPKTLPVSCQGTSTF